MWYRIWYDDCCLEVVVRKCDGGLDQDVLAVITMALQRVVQAWPRCPGCKRLAMAAMDQNILWPLGKSENIGWASGDMTSSWAQNWKNRKNQQKTQIDCVFQHKINSWSTFSTFRLQEKPEKSAKNTKYIVFYNTKCTFGTLFPLFPLSRPSKTKVRLTTHLEIWSVK